MKVKLSLKDALIVVDMQRDFMPGGSPSSARGR